MNKENKQMQPQKYQSSYINSGSKPGGGLPSASNNKLNQPANSASDDMLPQIGASKFSSWKDD